MTSLKCIQPAKISFTGKQPISDIFQDPYFSSVGAIVEKTHVFLQGNELESRFKNMKGDEIFVIAELGFGLGINFLLTMQLWEKYASSDAQLHFISTELNPLLKEDLTAVLTFFPELSAYAKKLIHQYPSLTPGTHRIHFGNITLTLFLGDAFDSLSDYVCDRQPNLQNQLRSFTVDAWYIDGFSPSKNPLLWQQDLFDLIALMSDVNTTLTTYSVSRSVKDALVSSGFELTKKKGIGRKREFLFAKKKVLVALNRNRQYKQLASPWHCAKNNVPLQKHHKIAVVGAGLAGTMMAYRLANRGFNVQLFEKESRVASLASGNIMGLVHFKLSAFHSPLNDFMLSAFLYAITFYTSIDDIECVAGVADLLEQKDFDKKKAQLLAFSIAYPQLIQFLSCSELSHTANVKLSKGGLFYPTALTLSPLMLCQTLSRHENIKLTYEAFTPDIEDDFDKIIFCGGSETKTFPPCQRLDLKPVPGMISLLSSTKDSKKLSIALSDNGYITPANNDGIHLVGGSYHMKEVTRAHQMHVDIINQMSDGFSGFGDQSFQFKEGIRAKTNDYLPYVGALPQVIKFTDIYAALSKDKNLRLENIPPYSSKYYVLSGFGSHGLTTIPLSVDIVLSQLLNEPLPVSQPVIKSLSPSRDLIKAIIT